MEMIATSVDQLVNVGDSPYHVPTDVQSNPEEYGDPFADMLHAIRQQNVFLDRIANASEAAREQPRPMMVKLSTVPFQTTVRLRVETIVMIMSDTGQAQLIVGSGVQQVWEFLNRDTKVLPYITIIDRGVDVSVAVLSGPSIPSAYLIAYPE